MKTNVKPNLWIFIARFALVHIAIYISIAALFLLFQNSLPESNRVALDLYQPFRTLSFLAIVGQLLRGLAFGFVFYPFYDIIFNRKGGQLLLLLSMWGVGLFGSVEPQPGSIEGILYTVISFTEHISVLVAVGIQMILFVWLMVKFERRISKNDIQIGGELFFPNQQILKGYTIRFTLLHLFSYWIVGGIFYQISGYQQALESMEIFVLWRPLENLPAVFLIFFGQIFRGLFLALLLYPFYQTYMQKNNGWALLYLLVAGLTILGSPIFLTEFISFEGTLSEFLRSLAVGIPEIFSQMLVFSLLFFYWQRKAETKHFNLIRYNMSVFLT